MIFLDAALPDPILENESLLPTVVIIAVVIAALAVVIYEIRKKRRSDKTDKNV